jgi:RHS repeat-associated protein
METPGRKTLIVAPPTPAGSKTLYYVEDHLGTVRVVTDETGTKANAEFHDYEPFGVEIPPSTNVAENTHQYTGQERDAATQMDYMHFRFYGSNLGRFMRPDNVMGTAMNPQDWNRYSYVHGNPVNFNDPTGHQAQHDKEGPDNTSDSTAATPPPQQKELGKGEAADGAQKTPCNGLKVGEQIPTAGAQKVGEVRECFDDMRKDPQVSEGGSEGEAVEGTSAGSKAAQTTLKKITAVQGAQKAAEQTGGSGGDHCFTTAIIFTEKSCPGYYFSATAGQDSKVLQETPGGTDLEHFKSCKVVMDKKPTPLPSGLKYQGIYEEPRK